jgi:predicted enzyme related to lactoylglutathione lyase
MLMTETTMQKVGTIGWVDLTVPNADDVRDFYQAVVGWTTTAVDMGGYSDYMMNAPDAGEGISGVCWKRGVNADLPSQWLMYITVADLDASIAATSERGGEILAGPRGMGSYGRYCVIRDPAGAVCALIQPAA